MLHLLGGSFGLVLYLSAVAALLLSIFWRPIAGIYYLIPLFPLQTIRYKLQEFPLGASIIGVMLAAVAIGLLRQGRPLFVKSRWTLILGLFFGYTFISLCFGSVYLGTGLPLPGDPRFGVWQEYVMLPWMLLLIAAIAPSRKHIRLMVLLMCIATLGLNRSYWNEVSGRDYSAYSEDLRNEAGGGAMGYAGSNGLAAYEAQMATFLLALAAIEQKRLFKLGFLALALFSTACLAYSLSRGGYAAMLVGIIFIGVVKQRTLLVVLTLFIVTWTAWVPVAVRDRVLMTYDKQDRSLDDSAETRITLWQDAMEVFRSSPLLGTGFNTYAYMHRIRTYQDTHNYFLKVLVETGLVGLALFLWLLWTMFREGFGLFRSADDPFFQALGLGLAGWMVAAFIANCFGDRWNYPQISAYVWIIGGFVAQGWKLQESGEMESDESGTEQESSIDAASDVPETHESNPALLHSPSGHFAPAASGQAADVQRTITGAWRY